MNHDATLPLALPLHCALSPHIPLPVLTTFHLEPYVLPAQICLDLQALLVTLPLEHFLFMHHSPGTHCLHTSALLVNYQPSNVN